MKTSTRILAIIQARMNSKRFPGKMMARADGKPVLEYVLKRTALAKGLHKIVVATSSDRRDDILADYCAFAGIPCYRGELEDVASRFAGALRAYPADGFLRINGDSPMMDPAVIEKGLSFFLNHDLPMVSNVARRTYPKGQSVEILKSNFFLDALPRMAEPADKEHVTRYFYREAASSILNFENPDGDFSSHNLSVDTAEDFEKFSRLAEKAGESYFGLTWKEILDRREAVSLA